MNLKKLAGEKAVEFVENGMVVGLGSGTTAYYAIQKIGEKVREGLKIKCICTSFHTRDLADKWNIPCLDIDEVDQIDLTIDGVDEVDPDGNGIKGGGGALLLEKIVASRSVQNIWVVEERKLIKQLGAFPLPVEIMPFGHQHLLRNFTRRNYHPELRKKGNEVYITDGGHFLADLHLGYIEDPFQLDMELKKIPGVLETGLFLNMVNKVVSASHDKVEVLTFR
jgi:ribose 5-phosphate isomerase A